ncbi:MAG: translation elongation factor Ts [SAR324 cluster bacterium]|nr:translation elongation factor Ts [SAR324 cluster bacterium]
MAIAAAKVMELRSLTGAGMMDCKRALEESGGDLEKAGEYLRKTGIAIAAKKASRDTNEGGIAVAFSGDGKSAAMVQLACETDFVALNEEFQRMLGVLTQQALERGGDDFVEQPLLSGEGTVGETLTAAIGKMGENIRLIDAKRLVLEGEGAIGGYVHSNGKIGVLLALGADSAVDGARLEMLTKDLSMHIAASPVSALTEEEIDPAEVEKEKEILVAQAKESGKPDEIVDKMVAGRLKKFVQENTLVSQAFVKDPDKTVAQVLKEAGQELGAQIAPVEYLKWQF